MTTRKEAPMKNSYTVESDVWGQSITTMDTGKGYIKFTVSDFDSGQTVSVGISNGCVKELIRDLEEILSTPDPAEDIPVGKHKVIVLGPDGKKLHSVSGNGLPAIEFPDDEMETFKDVPESTIRE